MYKWAVSEYSLPMISSFILPCRAHAAGQAQPPVKAAQADDTIGPGIPIDVPWKRSVVDFAKEHLHHSYYDPTRPETPEGTVLHDADTLDFLGAISAARILSLTEREAFAPDLSGAVLLLERLAHDAPPSLILPTSQEIGLTRSAELEEFLAALDRENYSGKAL